MLRGWRPSRMPPPRRFSIWGRIWGTRLVNVFREGVWSRPGTVNPKKPWRKRRSCYRIRPFGIFEGAFQFNQVLVRVDVLQRVGVNELGQPTWRLVEVKSSTKGEGHPCRRSDDPELCPGGTWTELADIC